MNRNKQFRIDDAHSYDKVVDKFDTFTDRFYNYAVDEVLARVPPNLSSSVLDIGCGSGAVTIAAARALGSQCRIIGLDLSAEMLSYASRKSLDAGLAGRIRFVEGDAEALTFRDGFFDSVVSLHVWRHLPDPAVATREVFRVLRSKGTFVLAVGSAPPMLSRHGVRAAFAMPSRVLAERRGLELKACTHLEQLVASHLTRPRKAEVTDWTAGHHRFSGSVAALLKGAGFQVRSHGWAGRSYVIDDWEDYWQLQATFSTLARKRIGDAEPGQVEALKTKFRRQCEAVQRRGGKMMYRVGTSILVAIKP